MGVTLSRLRASTPASAPPAKQITPTRPLAPVILKSIAWQTSRRLRGSALSVWTGLTMLSHFLHDYFMKAELDCGTVHLRESGAPAPSRVARLSHNRIGV